MKKNPDTNQYTLVECPAKYKVQSYSHGYKTYLIRVDITNSDKEKTL